MNFQNIIFSFCLFMIAVVTSTVPSDTNYYINGTQNIKEGSRQRGDRLLVSEHVRADGKFLRKVASDYFYPKGDNLAKVKITYFSVLDNYPTSQGGQVFVTEGGVGVGYLGLHFESFRGEGYDFIVTIYGVDN